MSSEKDPDAIITSVSRIASCVSIVSLLLTAAAYIAIVNDIERSAVELEAVGRQMQAAKTLALEELEEYEYHRGKRQSWFTSVKGSKRGRGRGRGRGRHRYDADADDSSPRVCEPGQKGVDGIMQVEEGQPWYAGTANKVKRVKLDAILCSSLEFQARKDQLVLKASKVLEGIRANQEFLRSLDQRVSKEQWVNQVSSNKLISRIYQIRRKVNRVKQAIVGNKEREVLPEKIRFIANVLQETYYNKGGKGRGRGKATISENFDRGTPSSSSSSSPSEDYEELVSAGVDRNPTVIQTIPPDDRRVSETYSHFSILPSSSGNGRFPGRISTGRAGSRGGGFDDTYAEPRKTARDDPKKGGGLLPGDDTFTKHSPASSIITYKDSSEQNGINNRVIIRNRNGGSRKIPVVNSKGLDFEFRRRLRAKLRALRRKKLL
ncbi:hypothetical protein WR25_25743 [Diploscapter pachys]|uniref:Uncharacterized protein n=1 Tax=Diploscapter pachys TaxID=2018661 RepID=A0A2A2JDU6_9BILA|nr:hypothetical protein WR25_25743 [Diploscapter pachys]